MKIKKYINNTVIFIVFCLVITILLSIILTTVTSSEEYNMIAKTIGTSYQLNPKSTEHILESLKIQILMTLMWEMRFY